jgi:hypothetical protein
MGRVIDNYATMESKFPAKLTCSATEEKWRISGVCTLFTIGAGILGFIGNLISNQFP